MFIAVLLTYYWFLPGKDGGTICGPMVEGELVPSPMCFEDILDWLGDEDYDKIRAGRKTLTKLFIGFYSIWVAGRLILPNWSDEDSKPDAVRKANAIKRADPNYIEEEEDDDGLPESQAFKPHIWRRATFLFLSCFVQFGLMIQMEFSYSAYFSVLVYEYIVIFNVCLA